MERWASAPITKDESTVPADGGQQKIRADTLIYTDFKIGIFNSVAEI